MVPGHRLRHARRHVLVRASVPGEQRDAVRGLLPVPRGDGANVPEDGGHSTVFGVLRSTTVGHRMLLHHDG